MIHLIGIEFGYGRDAQLPRERLAQIRAGNHVIRFDFKETDRPEARAAQSLSLPLVKISSYVGLSPCCCVQKARDLPFGEKNFGADVPSNPRVLGSPSET